MHLRSARTRPIDGRRPWPARRRAPGDRVALVDWGGVRATAATLAAAHLGAATAQMNPLLTAAELAQLVEASGCSPVGIAGAGGRVPLAEALGDAARCSSNPLAGREPERRRRARAATATRWCCSPAAPRACPNRCRSATERARPAGRLSAAVRPGPAAERGASCACRRSTSVGCSACCSALYAGDTTVVQPRFDAGAWLDARRPPPRQLGLPRAGDAGAHPRPSRLRDHRHDVADDDLLWRGGRAGRAHRAGHAAVARRGVRQRLRPDRDPRRLHDALTGRPPRPAAARVGRAARCRAPRSGSSTRRPATMCAAGEVGELWVRSPQNVSERMAAHRRSGAS